MKSNIRDYQLEAIADITGNVNLRNRAINEQRLRAAHYGRELGVQPCAYDSLDAIYEHLELTNDRLREAVERGEMAKRFLLDRARVTLSQMYCERWGRLEAELKTLRRWGLVNAKVAWHQANADQKRYGVMLAYAQTDWVDQSAVLDAHRSLQCARHCRDHRPPRTSADLIGKYAAIQIQPARNLGKTISVKV
ncbi:hypothetical protein DDSR119_57 [Pseudomonas phage DDSR119]|nr:hypothetical protein DDSR119_57 [Pseudomonas phage DDSR119]